MSLQPPLNVSQLKGLPKKYPQMQRAVLLRIIKEGLRPEELKKAYKYLSDPGLLNHPNKEIRSLAKSAHEVVIEMLEAQDAFQLEKLVRKDISLGEKQGVLRKIISREITWFDWRSANTILARLLGHPELGQLADRALDVVVQYLVRKNGDITSSIRPKIEAACLTGVESGSISSGGSAMATHIGFVRESNQDSLGWKIEGGVERYVVCDGISRGSGTYRHGELASYWAMSLFFQMAGDVEPAEIILDIHSNISGKVLMEKAWGEDATNTTILWLIINEVNRQMHLGWLGDSLGFYSTNTNKSGLIMIPHNTRWKMIRALGKDDLSLPMPVKDFDRLTKRYASGATDLVLGSHNISNTLDTMPLRTDEYWFDPYYSLGIDTNSDVVTTFMLLSDGAVAGEKGAEAVIKIAREHDRPEAIARAIVERALQCGGHDNASGIIVQVNGEIDFSQIDQLIKNV